MPIKNKKTVSPLSSKRLKFLFKQFKDAVHPVHLDMVLQTARRCIEFSSDRYSTGGLLTGSKTKQFYAFCLTTDCKGSRRHSTTRSYGQCGQKSHQPAPSAFCDCVFFLLVTFQAVLFEAPITQCKNKVCFQNYDAKHLTLIRIYSIYNWKVPFILLWVGILKGPLELIED